MTNDAMVARVIQRRLGSPMPRTVGFDDLIDVVAAVMDAFGFDADDEYVPPAQVTS